MGGMIAQELALRYPDRVDALVLGATSAGGRAATPPDAETLAFLRRRATVPDEEGRWASVPYVYSERTRGSGGRASARTSRAGGRTGSIPSATARSSRRRRRMTRRRRLGGIAAPTLVVHGAEDRMVPPANGRALAAAIAGSRLLEFEDAAHLYTTDEPAADEAVLEFLTPLADGFEEAADLGVGLRRLGRVQVARALEQMEPAVGQAARDQMGVVHGHDAVVLAVHDERGTPMRCSRLMQLCIAAAISWAL